MIKNNKSVLRYIFGKNSHKELNKILKSKNDYKSKSVIFFIDNYFRDNEIISNLGIRNQDKVIFVDSSVQEPTIEYVNKKIEELKSLFYSYPLAIVGIGGGSTMDISKAISNLFTNPGKAEDFQGWDLLENPGIYKIGIPTISGSGSESTRTCVMINSTTGAKLGMNSDHSMFDQIILDPNLTLTVPRNNFFWTGMDAYIHCIESLNGSYRNQISDALSSQTLNLCREIFLSDDMKSQTNREKLMVASYLGGCAIATSYVGVIHPFSAGLSVVLGTKHCVSNCIAMRAMKDFYPKEFDEFWNMSEKQNIEIPEGVCQDLSDAQFNLLYESTIIHEKPLKNALGDDYIKILNPDKVRKMFESM